MQNTPVSFPDTSVVLKQKKKVDLVKSFREHIESTPQGKSNYTANVAAFLTDLNNLRDQIDFSLIQTRINQKNVDMASFNADTERILKYVRKLELLDERFQSVGGNGRAVNIQFKWMDTYTEKEQTNTAIGFEISAMLFNFSRISYAQGLSLISFQTLEKLKESLRYLKMAAWSIDMLLTILPKSVGTMTFNGDISPPSLFMHMFLYKGTAAAALYHVAMVSGKFSHEEIAQVLKEVCRNFVNCKKVFDDEPKHPLNDKKNMRLKCSVLYLFTVFTALCYYYRSKEYEKKHNEDNFGGHFGIKLGYLVAGRKSLDELASFRKSYKDFDKTLASNDLQFLSFVEKTYGDELAETTKRNNQIYKQPVIEGSKLPMIQDPNMQLLKPNPPPVWTDPIPDESVFDAFKPQELVKYQQEFETQLQNLQMQISGDLQVFKARKDQILANTNLNQFLYFDPSRSAAQTIPPEIFTKRDTFMKNGGLNQYEKLANFIESEGERTGKFMKELRTKMENEAKIDMSQRMKYGEQWKRMPSDKAGKEWLDKLNCKFFLI